jgi:hypothetical protein
LREKRWQSPGATPSPASLILRYQWSIAGNFAEVTLGFEHTCSALPRLAAVLHAREVSIDRAREVDNRKQAA